MAYNVQVFANRYRFERVPRGWDTGRTGFTYLVYDLEKKRPGVIKRADVTSKHAVLHLRNEISALNALKGSYVPEVYEVGQAEYESNKYEYIVIEYISSLRIEENLDALNTLDRVEILSQFFSLLDRSHNSGIVNGDVDLKHLFWDKEKKKLVVIDWGNAKLVDDPRKKTEFSYDLARSAEIIYSLTTKKGHPPSTGSLALPNESLLRSDLLPIPDEFNKLCKWAPRTPVEGIQSPHTAHDLHKAAVLWKEILRGEKQPIQFTKNIKESDKKQSKSKWGIVPIILILFLLAVTVAFLGLSPKSPVYSLFHPTIAPPETPTEVTKAPIDPSPSVTVTLPPTETPTETPSIVILPTDTPVLDITPQPRENTILAPVFDQSFFPSECWDSNTNSDDGVTILDGFSQRDDNHWRFVVRPDLGSNKYIQTDFGRCFADKKTTAFAANIWVDALEMQRGIFDTSKDNSGRGIGFFIESANGKRREYTVWVDEASSMHILIRQSNDTVILDSTISLVNPKNLKVKDVFPRMYATFPIQIFIEIDNQGMDILYLREGPGQKAVEVKVLDSRQMLRIDSATQKTLGEIKSFGLIGYGGEIRTIVWPLVFFGE